ncbi:hypothetical protein KUTeg_012777 [Tegillarca granosa]|uniref:Lipase domain-containing protein n=1 Tax=Tegillarca granosa TaxID=220873 RepID=A0ABQ9F0J5_TEGGR|nr:hypothetical protein KUTeg_012777 [Tegillarca granosa]
MEIQSKMWKRCIFLALSVLYMVYSTESKNRQTRTTHSKCYSFLGCFTLDSTMPLPQEPNTINSTTMLFNRVSSGSPVATIGAQTFLTDIKQFGSYVDTRKETKVIVHGFMHSAKTAWVPKIKDELLKRGDFNVLVVDWSHGNGPDYDQAASNTYMVGTELAYLINHMKQHYALNTSGVHIIGHSLGAQVSGHAGHRIHKVGRITGLDPAEPHFTFPDPDTRLDSSDADFVDIIHTDGSVFKGFAGYGLKTALGHVDFYVNGGEHQPGCEEPTPSSINALLHGGVAKSINSPCKFYGHFCSSFSDFDSGHCNGCQGGLCPRMGYDVDRSSQKGSYYLATTSVSPFCEK